MTGGAKSELDELLTALAQVAKTNLESPQSGAAVAHLNAARLSMGWLRRAVETDDASHMVMVALQSALQIGAALSPEVAEELRAAVAIDAGDKTKKQGTDRARQSRTEEKSRRQEVMKEYFDSAGYIPSGSMVESLLVDENFKRHLKERDLKCPKRTVLREDLEAIELHTVRDAKAAQSLRDTNGNVRF